MMWRDDVEEVEEGEESLESLEMRGVTWPSCECGGRGVER